MNKNYYLQMNIGRAKYVINYHDGVKTHDDGSPFYGIHISRNKKDVAKFITELTEKGYRERA